MKNKYWIKIAVSLLTLFLFLVLGNVVLSDYVRRQILKTVRLLNTVEIEGVQVSIAAGSISFSDINFIGENGSVELNSSSVELSGINWSKLYYEGFLEMDKIHLKGVVGEISAPLNAELPKEGANPDTSIEISKVSVKKISLTEANITYQELNGSRFRANGINLNISQFRLPIGSPIDSVSFEDIALSMRDGEWQKGGNMHRWQWKGINANQKKASLLIQGLQLIPLHSEKDWINHIPYRLDRLEAKFPQIELIGFDMEALLKKNAFFSDTMVVDNVNLHVLIEERKDLCESCYKPFLNELIMQSGLPLDIKILKIKRSLIALSLNTSKKLDVLDIGFKNIYATLSNITNLEKKVAKNPQMQIEVQAVFAQESSLKARINLCLSCSDYSYGVQGVLGRTYLPDLNGRFGFKPNFNIASGSLERMTFDFNGNNSYVKGVLAMQYDSLKIVLLDENNERKKLLSSLINLGLRNESNTRKGQVEAKSIYYERDRRRSIFHQWWGAIRSGIKASILPQIFQSEEGE